MSPKPLFTRGRLLSLALVLAVALISLLLARQEQRQTERLRPGGQGEDASLGERGGHPVKRDVPLRVASLSPATTEWLHALGFGDRQVVRTENCDWPPVVAELPSVGAFLEPHVGALVQAKPDLVLVTSDFNPRRVAELERAGLNVFVLETRQADDLVASVAALARLLRGEAPEGGEAEEWGVGSGVGGSGDPEGTSVPNDDPLVAALDERWAGTRPLFENSPTYIGFVDVRGEYVFSRESFLGSVFGRVGLQNLVETNQSFPQVATEFLQKSQPDLVFVFHPGAERVEDPEGVFETRGLGIYWSSPPVQVVSFPEDIFLRPGPRLFEEGLDLLEELVREARGL